MILRFLLQFRFQVFSILIMIFRTMIFIYRGSSLADISDNRMVFWKNCEIFEEKKQRMSEEHQRECPIYFSLCRLPKI